MQNNKYYNKTCLYFNNSVVLIGFGRHTRSKEERLPCWFETEAKNWRTAVRYKQYCFSRGQWNADGYKNSRSNSVVVARHERRFYENIGSGNQILVIILLIIMFSFKYICEMKLLYFSVGLPLI